MTEQHESGPGAQAGLPRAEPERLAAILDTLPGQVAMWDLEGRNRYANRGYLAWFGRTTEELAGVHLSEVLGAELYALNAPHVEAVLAGRPQVFERVIPDRRGSVRHLQVEYVPHVEDGRPAGFVTLVSDITASVRGEKALQEQVRQIALLGERQRIAADLHDLVVQRLFAAGLDLAAVQRGAPDAEARLASAAVGVDEGIRELRLAIHSLQKLMDPLQVPAAVEAVLQNAERMLGFAPDLTYLGSLETVSPDVVQDLLAVLNESLSNVARHARAGSVQVTLAVVDGHVVLRVADDGRGPGQSTRSSGLTNMRQRAERHRGAFLCRENHPRGTVVEWTVPAVPSGDRTESPSL